MATKKEKVFGTEKMRIWARPRSIVVRQAIAIYQKTIIHYCKSVPIDEQQHLTRNK